MARWKLATAHYLKCDNVEWEYQETDRATGQPRRVRVPVPRLLDPLDKSCWNYRWGNKDNEDGEVIVCHRGAGEPKDIIFEGDPTPDMIPLDDEAKAISASFAERWSYKPDTDPAGGFSQSMIDKFQLELAEKESKTDTTGMKELATSIQVMAEQNAELLKILAARRI